MGELGRSHHRQRPSADGIAREFQDYLVQRHLAETALGGISSESKVSHAMKLNMKPTKKDSEDMAGCATKTSQLVNKPDVSAKADVPKRFRRLKWNEVVSLGDFVAGQHRGFEPWEGPSGFQANAFVKPIYRRDESRSTVTKKLE